ncbi:MAG: ribosomal protein S18-alanine N-acetyltransferase [Acidobacteria bacterium]|nr:ribosomal protein S18-alanine N-acetyltransferase [Acidobacteriota bacterium]
MAVLQSLRDFFIASAPRRTEIVPAPPTVYEIRPLTKRQLREVAKLNLRCFARGENYSRHTFTYLLDNPETLSYSSVTSTGEMTGFIFAMMNQDGAAHITTIGVAPEHRRRDLASRLLAHLEDALRAKGVSTVVLEVRVSNLVAQELYKRRGYASVQLLKNYYSNGEDGYLMTKSLI